MRFAALAAVPLIAMAGCADEQNPQDIRPPQVITVGEDYDYRFRAEHGDQINVVMNPVGDMRERCDHMGGVLTHSSYTEISTCEDVDF